MQIMFNLVKSGSLLFDHGNCFIDGDCQWILDRFAIHMTNRNEIRLRNAALLLFSALLTYQRDHRKVFIIQNYDMIKTLLQVVKEEKVLRLLMIELDLIEKCFLKIIYEP